MCLCVEDGDLTTDSMNHPCTHTNTDNGAWWLVDLGKNIKVGKVQITNRGDCCSKYAKKLVSQVTDICCVLRCQWNIGTKASKMRLKSVS